MTFETKKTFNFSVKSVNGQPGNINFIFDNGNVRFYNKTANGDQPKVGIGINNLSSPEARLDVRGGIKIDTCQIKIPLTGDIFNIKMEIFLVLMVLNGSHLQIKVQARALLMTA